LKFADYPAQFGSYKLKGFYIPIDYKIKAEDSLTKKDIYNSADKLNKKYGINAVLVGSSIMGSDNISAKVKELVDAGKKAG